MRGILVVGLLLAGPLLARGEPELRVVLRWSAPVDLDLFVTDPDQETVYFANDPVSSGGTLARDVRCGAGSPPFEEVVEWEQAPPGRYRVGVDFPRSCNGPTPEAEFRVLVDVAGDGDDDAGNGDREIEGRIGHQQFLPVVVELELPASGGDEP